MRLRKLFAGCISKQAEITVRHGRLAISEDVTNIPARRFEGNKKIETVVIPGPVKSIESRAFAECENLRSVTLGEGIEFIANNVFTGCKRLRAVRLPASIQTVNGWAFYKSGLIEPVFSADGRVLVYYPQNREGAEYDMPEGVEEIGSCAFIDVAQLVKVSFPGTLKRIHERAFIDCGLQEIEIPAGVKVEYGAFCGCVEGFHLSWAGERGTLEKRMDSLRAQRQTFLYGGQLDAPMDQYWKDADFQILAKRCAVRDVRAMEEMCGYFSARRAAAADGKNARFYQCAEQFWRVRAWLYGSESSGAFLEKWAEGHAANVRMVSPGITERLSGSAEGKVLNALGFSFFDPVRTYRLDGVDEHELVEVSTYESEDGPDEDGFGAETYYDWWYLDDCLNLPAGAGYIHSYSRREKNCNENKFRELHIQVEALVKKQRC